MASDAKESA